MEFGAHAFLWISDWTTDSGNRAIRAAASEGFDFIEIPLLRPDGFEARSHRRELTEAGIEANAIGKDDVFLHGDTYHMNIEEEGFFDPIVAAGNSLGYLHMSESHRGLVGSGTVDWDDVFAALRAMDYRGPLVLESFAAINPDLQAATKLWRPPSQPPETLAREGLVFLREHAARAGLRG
jgi:predicted xylose isomerase-like sugar epimerase